LKNKKGESFYFVAIIIIGILIMVLMILGLRRYMGVG